MLRNGLRASRVLATHGGKRFNSRSHGLSATVLLAAALLCLPNSAGATTTYEAEDLTVAGNSGDTVQMVSKPEASDGQFLLYKSNEVSDHITVTVNAPQADVYDIGAIIPKNAWRGKFQLSVDGFDVGGIYDGYNATQTYPTATLATAVSLSAGNHAFKFTVTGKHASSADYQIAVDTVTLEPVTATYEGEHLTIANNSGDTIQIVSKPEASAGNFLLYKANAMADFITVTVNAPHTGTYDIEAVIPKNAWRGVFQLSVDGIDVGSAYDAYAAALTFTPVTLATGVNLTAGNHALKFTVTGKNASSADYQIAIDTLTLDAVPGGDTTPPTVSMTAPPDSSTVFGTSVAVSADADDNVGVEGVQFKLNGANLGMEDTTSPYGITWNTTTVSDATHVLTATARDAAGNNATSTGRLVTVNNTRQVFFTGAFESGQINEKTNTTDGFFIHTLPINQIGSDSLSSGQGGFGPTVGADTRVIASRTPPTTGNGVATEGTVLPRAGSYFLESALHYDKNYTELNGGLHKPRTKINPIPDERFDFDVEGWTGFSIYLPTNMEIESNNARRMLLHVMNTNASATLFSIEISAPEVGKTKWAAIYYTDDTSTTESAAARTVVDLGLIADDLGKWTDFVVRYRFNPFTGPGGPTNASTISGGKDWDYEHDKGILQLWKATGSADGSGNRTMFKFIDLVDTSVGLVPKADLKIQPTFKQYKPTWQTASTTVAGPIWVGFDEIRIGFADADGTGYSDVHPTQQAKP